MIFTLYLFIDKTTPEWKDMDAGQEAILILLIFAPIMWFVILIAYVYSIFNNILED